MRDSFGLDPGSLSALAASLRADDRERRQGTWMTLAAPLLGFVPAELQLRWERRWSFPARTATMLSGLIEMVAGGVGTVQLILILFSPRWFLPDGLRWLAFLGPILLPEAMIRLHHVNAHGEPIGSVLAALPLLPFTPRKPTRSRRSGERGALATVVSTAFVTVPMFFAPRRYQETWARKLGLWPPLLTLLSAVCEIAGGAIDVIRDGGGGGILTLVSLLVLADGLSRLLLAVLTVRPVGSVFGLPFLRYYDRWVGRVPPPA